MYPASHAAPSHPCSAGACTPPTAATQAPQTGLPDRVSRQEASTHDATANSQAPPARPGTRRLAWLGLGPCRREGVQRG
jgi:hypothetical protein